MRWLLFPLLLLVTLATPFATASAETKRAATPEQLRLMRTRIEELALVKETFVQQAEVHVSRSALEAQQHEKWSSYRLETLAGIFREQEVERRKRLPRGTKFRASVDEVVGERLARTMKEILRRAWVDNRVVTMRYAGYYRKHVARKVGLEKQIYRAEKEVARSSGAKLQEAKARLEALKAKLAAMEEGWANKAKRFEEQNLTNYPQWPLMKMWDDMKQAMSAALAKKRRAG